MFANPTPLPEHEVPSIIQQAEQRQQQQAQNYSPARGTDLGKTDGRSQKRVRVDTPQPGKEEGRDGAVRESQDGEVARARKRVRFDVASADGKSGGVESVRDRSEGETVNDLLSSDKETRRAESVGDEADSSDDCAWSVDSADGEERKDKEQDPNGSSDHDSSVARELEQRTIETEDSSHRS